MPRNGNERRITSNPAVCGGQPCIRGTRIPIHVLLGFLAAGDTVEDLLREYPQLEREDVLAALAYAARLAREETEPLGDGTSA